MRDFLKALLEGMIGLLVTLIIVFSIVYIGFKFDKRADQKKYNGGICPRCGGNYIYEQAVTHLYDTDYVYICDKCGDMIELESYRPQERNEE